MFNETLGSALPRPHLLLDPLTVSIAERRIGFARQ